MSALLMVVGLAVGAGDYDGVSVGVLDPDFAMARAVAFAGGWVSMRRPYDGRGELLCAGHGAVEVGDVAEPQQNAAADGAVRVTDSPVMMLDLAVVELKHQNPVGEQPFVLWAAVVAV